MSTGTRFEKEAKGNSEMAYYVGFFLLRVGCLHIKQNNTWLLGNMRETSS